MAFTKTSSPDIIVTKRASATLCPKQTVHEEGQEQEQNGQEEQEVMNEFSDIVGDILTKYNKDIKLDEEATKKLREGSNFVLQRVMKGAKAAPEANGRAMNADDISLARAIILRS